MDGVDTVRGQCVDVVRIVSRLGVDCEYMVVLRLGNVV